MRPLVLGARWAKTPLTIWSMAPSAVTIRHYTCQRIVYKYGIYSRTVLPPVLVPSSGYRHVRFISPHDASKRFSGVHTAEGPSNIPRMKHSTMRDDVGGWILGVSGGCLGHLFSQQYRSSTGRRLSPDIQT